MPFCHNCGTNLGEKVNFCPSCGAAYLGNQSSQQNTPTPTSQPVVQPSQSFQTTPTIPVQQSVFLMGKAKSVGVAFLLAFLLGPLGLLYASIIGGFVMFFVGVVLFFLLPIAGIFVTWIGSIIWAIVAADQANKDLANKRNVLFNSQIYR